MYHRSAFLIVILIMLVPFRGQADTGQFRQRLGCIPLLATTLQAMAFTEKATVSLLNSIEQRGNFEVVERKKIENVLELEGLRLDNLTADNVLKVGSRAGLDYIVHGFVSTAESGMFLDIKVFNVRSRKLILTDRFRLSESDFSANLKEVAEIIKTRVKENTATSSKTNGPLPAPELKPPTRLQASGTANSINLRWNHAEISQVVAFNVYRATAQDGYYSLLVATTVPFFTDTNLKLNEVFFYRVSATGRGGVMSAQTPPVRAGTVIAPPAPIFMNIEPDIKSAHLAWRARPGAREEAGTDTRHYVIYRRQGDTPFSQIGRVSAETLAYTDRGLAEGEKYIYLITAANQDGTESEYSTMLSVSPLPAPKPPQATGGRIRHVPLVWEQYEAQVGDGYVVYRATAQEGQFTAIARTDGLNRTSYVDRAVSDKSTYWYRLAVYKKDGSETAPSAAVEATTHGVPLPPTDLSAVSNQFRQVTLRWRMENQPEDEVRSVLIYRKDDPAATAMQKIGEVAAGALLYVDERPPLAEDTTYYYRVTAVNSGGAESRFSNSVAATTKAPPVQPAKLTAASGGVKNILLRWERNPEADIVGYHLFARNRQEMEFMEISFVSGTSFRHDGLKDGAEYEYKIKAKNSDGVAGSFSDPVVARTKPQPVRVTGVKVADATTRTITWKPNPEGDIRMYHIYKQNFLGLPQRVGTVAATQWRHDEPKGHVELFVTASDVDGLESEPSLPVMLD